MVSLSMFERQSSAKAPLLFNTALLNKLWLQLPPPEVIATSQSGWIDNTKFNYTQPAVFASSEKMANDLVRVTAYFVPHPAGFAGLRFHFTDGTVVPDEEYTWGTGLDFLIDGPRGERIVGVDVAYSHKHEYFGVNVSRQYAQIFMFSFLFQGQEY